MITSLKPRKKHQYEVHPAAQIFPMLTDDEFDEFKEDVRVNGCQDPIALWHGQLLDGRNRLKACLALGLEPPTYDLPSDTDPIAFVLSKNLQRRHMNVSQRAMCAGKLANLKRGGDRVSQDFKTPNGALVTQNEAAHTLGVSGTSVDRAKTVIREGSKELVEAVQRGEVNVSLASKLVEQVPDKKRQSRLVTRGAQTIRRVLADERPKRPRPGQDKQNQRDELVCTFRDLWFKASLEQKRVIRAMVLAEDELN